MFGFFLHVHPPSFVACGLCVCVCVCVCVSCVGMHYDACARIWTSPASRSRMGIFGSAKHSPGLPVASPGATNRSRMGMCITESTPDGAHRTYTDAYVFVCVRACAYVCLQLLRRCVLVVLCLLACFIARVRLCACAALCRVRMRIIVLVLLVHSLPRW